jgi:hypothetical protein
MQLAPQAMATSVLVSLVHADDVALRCRYSCQWWFEGPDRKSLHATPHHFLSAIAKTPDRATSLKKGGGMPDFEEWKFDRDLEFNGVPAVCCTLCMSLL